MEPRSESKSRFRIEKLEERIAPAHLGGRDVILPTAASAGTQGLETANDTPTHVTPTGAEVPHHIRKLIIIF
jgi:hypothetical protein